MDLIRKICRLGMGDVAGRICSVAIVMLIGHRFGVVALGAYALAQGLAQYTQPLIDFGLRHVGARLLAAHPESGALIVRCVQRRRWAMAVGIAPLLFLYAGSTKLPAQMREFLLVFALTGILYAASLDWAAWGKEHLQLVGLAKAIVPLCTLLFLAGGWNAGRAASLWWIAAGNAVGYLVQAAALWFWWQRQAPGEQQAVSPEVIMGQLRWRHTGVMGIALLCNLAFNMIDTLMLGLMSTPTQVGLYSAAYRILNQVLATYYLLTQTLYPQFARLENRNRAHQVTRERLLWLAGGGLVLALLLVPVRSPILVILFGPAFATGGALLGLLLFSIPCDFVTSYLSSAYIAWGKEKTVLAATAVAAGSNVLLNALTIGRYGAKAAAVNTLISYALFLATLLLAKKSAIQSGKVQEEGFVLAHD